MRRALPPLRNLRPSGRAFFVVSAALAALVSLASLAAPADPREISLSWEPIDGARAYEILIETVQDKQWSPIENGSRRTTQPDLNLTLPPGEYRLKIRSLDRRGVPGVWSDPESFSIKPPPPPPPPPPTPTPAPIVEKPKPLKPTPPAKPEPVVPDPGPPVSTLYLAGSLGYESFTAVGGLSDFSSEAPIAGAELRASLRADPTRGDRWVAGTHLTLHPFYNQITYSDGTTSLQSFYRFNGGLWAAYEFFQPRGRPWSLLLGLGASAGRIPAFTETNVNTGLGDLQDQTWATLLLHAETSYHPMIFSGFGASLDSSLFSFGVATISRHTVRAHWRPALVGKFLPRGWFTELAGSSSSETRTHPFSCSGQPACETSATTESMIFDTSAGIGAEF